MVVIVVLTTTTTFPEQLKARLNLNVDEMDKLTLEDLRQQVDHSVREVSSGVVLVVVVL